jgi:hypothetical protein
MILAGIAESETVRFNPSVKVMGAGEGTAVAVGAAVAAGAQAPNSRLRVIRSVRRKVRRFMM